MQKESVRAFKNELRNYQFYLSRVRKLYQSIDACFDKLGGVRGIDPSKEPLHTLPNKDLEYALRDEIEFYERQKKLLEAKILYIDQILAKMEEPTRTAVIEVYVKGRPIAVVCNEMYISSSGLQKRMNKQIELAL